MGGGGTEWEEVEQNGRWWNRMGGGGTEWNDVSSVPFKNGMQSGPCKQMRCIFHLHCWPHRRSHNHGRTASVSLATECSEGDDPQLEALSV